MKHRSTAKLGSVHTIDVYDYGITEDGDFYYVMELLNGISLERYVKQFGPMPPGRVVYLLQQVCHSLSEAHGRADSSRYQAGEHLRVPARSR